MNTFSDWISAWSAAITAGLTFGVLVAALWAASAARDTLAQMKSDSEGQRRDSARATRPYVHARMVPSIAGIDAWDLVIENTGRTSAYDLALQIDPKEGMQDPGDIVTAMTRKFADAGHTLHPGGSFRMYMVLGATEKDPTGFRRATVTLAYTDSEDERYVERPVVLDPDTVGSTPAPFTGKVRNEDDDDSIPKNTLNTLRAIAHHLGEGNR